MIKIVNWPQARFYVCFYMCVRVWVCVFLPPAQKAGADKTAVATSGGKLRGGGGLRSGKRSLSMRVCVYVCVWMRVGLASAHLLTDFYLSGQNRKRSLSFVIGAPPSVKPSILLSFSLIHVLYCAHHYRTVWITGFIPRPQSPNTLSGLQISYNEELLFLDKD